MRKYVSQAAVAAVLIASPAFAQSSNGSNPAEVDAWVKSADKSFADETVKVGQADWVYSTYINDDSAAVDARANAEFTKLQVTNANKAAELAKVPGLSAETQRLLNMFRTQIVNPVPSSAGAADEYAGLAAKLSGIYGKGKGTLNGKPINGSDIEEAMGTSRNPAELKEMWLSWNDNVGKPMKADYVRMVEIANAGAKELGYADLGSLWRSNYDMTPDAFAATTERMWNEVKPLYEQIHCYTRLKLNEKYGDSVQARTGPIRADLLGNMWAQEWGNIYDIVAPKGAGDVGYDVGELLRAKGYDPVRMVKAGEGFYTSLGLQALPASFWERSQIVKPADREVICHASAWNVDNKEDLRIKMCTKVNGDDFTTIHHELGHNFYQRAYNGQPYRLYMEGANDGFHEAIGDTMALSITPEYLVQIGLLDQSKVPGADKDTGLLLRQAMDKVAFLPFGLLIDRYRWKIFSGEIQPADYNTAWTKMRLQYQGITPPGERGPDAFDAGAKYHVPAVVPYTRYFLARILQFQFFEAACKQAGWKGPLHRCSFYGNKAVGEKLNAMLTMGASKPWPDALEAFTGSREMSGKSMIKYFAPLTKYLKSETKGQKCGW
ncbi:M2 family metallopeptidase [Novosphingobium sp.]|uniref:M2 family metallopeptidase n=1 Tax=Novosphingobium sp. TaxID=1874826 RepID=UPI00286E7230|nr:M2 family metallopeptidase [Novosphingobium sp.]